MNPELEKALADYDAELCPAPGIFVRAVRELLEVNKFANALIGDQAQESERIFNRLKLETQQWHAISDRNVARANYLEGAQKWHWCSIESAPKDGTKILLMWRSCKHPALGSWVIEEGGEGWRCDGDQCIPKNQHDCLMWYPIPPI